MSVNLEKVLRKIQNEKTNKLKAENIRYGVNALGVQGTLRPVQIDGGDVGLAIYTQLATPEANQGIWLKTDKTWDKIYLENERYNTNHKIIFSNDTTLDPSDTSNIILGRTVPVDLLSCDYCQRGNVAHFFGYWSSDASQNTTTKIHQHYKYDFDTNTWTQLSACPTPQGGSGCVWVDDDTIYIIGSHHTGYGNYVYKYTISTDTWEQITGILDNLVGYGSTPYNGESYMTDACYDIDRDVIYFSNNSSVWKYDFNENNVQYITNAAYFRYSSGTDLLLMSVTSAGGKSGMFYYNNSVFFGIPYSGNYIMQLAGYNITNNTYVRLAPNAQNQASGSITVSNITDCSNGIVLLSQNNYGSATNCAVLDVSSSKYYVVSNTGTTFSAYKLTKSYPILFIQNDNYNIILNMYGTNASSMSALTLNDKSYDFETNTLVINSEDGLTSGAYKTEIYRNEKVLNGLIYNRFNDVNLYDVTTQKLVKNIETYYGNGTDWVKIK